MTTMLTTTTATRPYYADAISDAIAEAEAILGTLIVTRIECVAVFEPTPADPLHLYVTGYRAAVECTKRRSPR